MRSVSGAAVDKSVSAHGSYEEYRPRESPAKHDITDGAGDAVGTLRRLLGISFFLPRPPQRPGLLKAALNAFVAEERVLMAPWA
jgi:hypothetical protein